MFPLNEHSVRAHLLRTHTGTLSDRFYQISCLNGSEVVSNKFTQKSLSEINCSPFSGDSSRRHNFLFH